MFAGISHSLSGLAAAQAKINSAAHNIANAHTSGFENTRTRVDAAGSGGAQVTLDQSQNSLVSRVQGASGDSFEFESSQVNLEEEVVNLLIAKRSFEVNVKAIEIQDQALGTLLDIIE